MFDRSVFSMVVVGFLTGVAAIGCGYDGPRMTVEEMKSAIDSKRPITVVDLRPASLFRQGHIPGSINIPKASLDERFELLSTLEAPVVLLCHCGRNALEACRELALAGIDVTLAVGGFQAWKQAGYPLERGPQTGGRL